MYLVIANDTTPQLTAGLRWFYRTVWKPHQSRYLYLFANEIHL